MTVINTNWEPYIETQSGRKFTFLSPKPDDIDITDIAHALSQQCRYNGHCKTFYSVAEHSVLVASRLHPGIALAGLLHDAAEAYLSDIPSPIKHYLPDYEKLEAGIEEAIFKKFHIWDTVQEHKAAIKKADLEQLATEAHYLLVSRGEDWSWTKEANIKVDETRKPLGMPPGQAFAVFMDYYMYLTKKQKSRIWIPNAA